MSNAVVQRCCGLVTEDSRDKCCGISSVNIRMEIANDNKLMKCFVASTQLYSASFIAIHVVMIQKRILPKSVLSLSDVLKR